MKIKSLRNLSLAMLALVGALALTSCKKGTGERAGEAVDRAAEKTKEAAGKAVEKTGEALEKAGDAVEDTGEKMQQ